MIFLCLLIKVHNGQLTVENNEFITVDEEIDRYYLKMSHPFFFIFFALLFHAYFVTPPAFTSRRAMSTYCMKARTNFV